QAEEQGHWAGTAFPGPEPRHQGDPDVGVQGRRDHRLRPALHRQAVRARCPRGACAPSAGPALVVREEAAASRRPLAPTPASAMRADLPYADSTLTVALPADTR